MIGPRDRRSPYHGTWYAYCSNGWGILDFMDFSEAAGVEVLAAPLEAVNSAIQAQRVIPARTEWRHNLPGAAANYAFRPFSFTVMRFE